MQHLATLSSSIPIQFALSHYLTYYSYDNHLKKLRKVLHERKQNYINLLTECLPPDALIHQAEGGYCIWTELPKNVCVETLYDKALEHNISVAPGIIFSGDKRFNHHIRLNSSYAGEDKIAQANKALGELVVELSNGNRDSV